MSATAGFLLGGPTALIGTGLRKLTHEDQGIGGHIVLGTISLLTGGPGGLIAYATAEPGYEASQGVQDAKQKTVSGRYE